MTENLAIQNNWIAPTPNRVKLDIATRFKEMSIDIGLIIRNHQGYHLHAEVIYQRKTYNTASITTAIKKCLLILMEKYIQQIDLQSASPLFLTIFLWAPPIPVNKPFAVHPIENSLSGRIHRNYDILLRHRHCLHIVVEVQFPVHHCMLTLSGVRKEYLTQVMSHPQALAQCKLTLTHLRLNITREAFNNTTGAAEYVANNEGTSVLFKVLSTFTFRDISLTKIESCPRRHRQALQVHVLCRLRGVHGGNPRPNALAKI
ncbi:arogenate/prephenate dehydratase [Canna indica]|uniref:Arogenate/prephenate dehydratase n=1 Tax=Canna indica TaxID=4628 RepID=A0AAQ3JST1_9LILI|nr:arogenate/prephenate dehydratase [Canna indica]